MGGLPKGPERWKAAGAVLVLALIPSLVFSFGSLFLKKFRKWSSESLICYILEIAFFQSFILLYTPQVHSYVGKHFNYDYRAALSVSPIMFSGSLVLVLLAFALMHQAERKIFGRLSSANEMIYHLERDRRELIEADETIRGQTSRILHDRVQSNLMVVGMKLRTISGKNSVEVDEVLAKAISLLEETRSADIKNLIQTLTPNLGTGGLKPALNSLAFQYESTMDVSTSISLLAETLDTHTLLGIFRIIEQAILNSLLHGPASKVHIEVETNLDFQTKLLISDNGPGTDTASAGSGIGTAIIDSWVSILKGEKKIDSAPGHGYQLQVIFPK